MRAPLSYSLIVSLLLALVPALTALAADSNREHVLFDGSGLGGWRSNDETVDVFTVLDDGTLQVKGGRAHLFWVGKDDVPAEFVDFEFRAQVKTTPGANSGIFFHTKFQAHGWPQWGLEAQVNSTHKDARKTGSVYAILDILNNAPSIDGEWFEYVIRVEGKAVTVSVAGKVVNTYVEPEQLKLSEKKPHIRLGQGTFAIQGHDPKSTIYYRDIRVVVLD